MEIDEYTHDDDLMDATQADRRSRVRVYRYPERAVVLGKGSRPEVEVDTAACSADGVPLLRRHGGGCAVLLDPGDVIVSVTLAAEGILGSRGHFERISAWLIEGLAEAGVTGVRREGASDLAIGERKIAGACIYRSQGLFYYSASLLVEPDVDAVERYLRHPPREPEYRRGRRHRDFMGSLAVMLGRDGIPAFTERLSRALEGSLAAAL